MEWLRPDPRELPPFERALVEREMDIARRKLSLRPGDRHEEAEIAVLEQNLRGEVERVYASLTPMQRVQVCRFHHRPMTLDCIHHGFQDFFELHGDRRHPEDTAIVGGLATLERRSVVVIGHQRGHNSAERSHRNNGMPNPDGLRKAHRLMRLAERFGMPLVLFVDTPGAFPGAGAEERGMMHAIARSLLHLSRLQVPTLSVTIGEGGSGGALALALADQRMILQHAVFSVISPEGCASILWRDAQKAPLAADLLKLTAEDLVAMGVMDEVLPEPPGGAHRHPEAAMDTVRHAIARWVDRLCAEPIDALVTRRQRKIRDTGAFVEFAPPEP